MRVFLSTHLQIKYQKFYWPIRDNIPNFTSPTLCMTILSGASLEIKQTRFLEALFGKSQFIMSYYYRSLNSIVKKHPSVGSSVWFIVLSKQRVGCTSFLTRFMKNILEVLWGATDGNIKILHCFHSNHCRTLRLFFNEIFDWSVLWKISAKKKTLTTIWQCFQRILGKDAEMMDGGYVNYLREIVWHKLRGLWWNAWKYLKQTLESCKHSLEWFSKKPLLHFDR